MGLPAKLIIGLGDFPPAYRLRDNNTDRIPGVQFNPRIPPL